MTLKDLVTPAAIAIGAITLFVAWRLSSRIHIGEDFALARRRLPAVLTGLSQAISGLPLWLCMAITLLAYSIGLGALWMALANLIGMSINWWLVAPRLRTLAAAGGSENISKWFAASAGDRLQNATLRSSACIVVFALGLGTLTFVQWAAQSLIAITGGQFSIAVAAIVLTILAVTLLAGLWASSTGDAAQAIIILIIFVVLAISGLHEVGSWNALWSELAQRELASGPWFAGYFGVLSIAFVVGMLFAAFGSAAQPHVISNYLACRDDDSLRHARLISLGWCALCLSGALLVGWCARVLLSDMNDGRSLLVAFAEQTLSARTAKIIGVCIMVSYALACASPWVVAATHIATDFRSYGQSLSLIWCRVALLLLGVSVGVGAVYFPVGTEDRLWLCWQSISAAFGPLLLVRLTGKRVRPGSSLGAMWSGFILTILFHLMPDTPGDLLERSLPFIAALGIALSGGERRRNPDRADRGDRTVHDHLPI